MQQKIKEFFKKIKNVSTFVNRLFFTIKMKNYYNKIYYIIYYLSKFRDKGTVEGQSCP